MDVRELLCVSKGARSKCDTANGNGIVKLRLTAERGFQATSAAPALLRFSVALSGLPGETFTLPVINQLPEGEPLFLLAEGAHYYPLVPSAPGNEPLFWKGPEDLGAKVFLSRRGDRLLLRAEVRDDAHVQPYRGFDVYQGDNLQFGLRLPGQDRLWKFGLTRLADGRPEVYCWNSPGSFNAAAAAAEIRLETGRDEAKKTTVYRAEIPFQAVGMTPATASGGFRFNLLVNDNDGKLREGFLFAAPGFGAGDDAAAWPLVNLP